MDRSRQNRWVALRAVFVATGLITTLARAGVAAPQVRFDVAQVVSCREVVAPECLKERPRAPVMEVVFDVSARLVEGKEASLKSVTYEITSPGHLLTFVAFAPTTLLASDTADGLITVEEHETPAQLNIEYAGSQAKLQAPLRTPIDKKVTQKKLAPKSLLISSGTFDRAHGVYFTFYQSPFETLQRTQSLICYFEADANFRADYVRLVCRAESDEQESSERTKTGTSQFQIALYREGDGEARSAADRLAARQQEFNRAAMAYRSLPVVERPKAESPSPLSAFLHLVSGERGGRSRAAEVTAMKPVVETRTAARLDFLQAQQAIETAQRELRELNGTTR